MFLIESEIVNFAHINLFFMKSLSRFLALTKFLLAISLFAFAQDEPLPATDIYLLEISTDKKGKLKFENPVRITKNDNYDNEPWWYPDGSAILYAGVSDSSAGDTSKADIYKYDVNAKRTRVVINTPQTAEYSPVLMPNKTGISVVRVLEDKTSQVFANCNDNTDECVNLLPKIKNVGYYVWMDASRVALYLLGDPAILVAVNLTTGKIDTVAEDIGRCLQKVPGKNVQIAYVDKSESRWLIKTYDGKSGKKSTIVETLEEQEDFCYMPDGSLLMGAGSDLYHYVPPTAVATTTAKGGASSKNDSKEEKPDKPKKNDNPWDKVAEFEGTSVAQFYRIAVSPKGDKIAVVTYPDEKPQ